MLFWRIFLFTFGMAFGAILGLDIAALMRWSDCLLILILSGALLGGTFGWALSVLIPKAVEWLRVRLPLYEPPTPPPPEVLRLGWSLGIAEGIVVGATEGGVLAAVVGGYFGMILGSFAAALSWQVRRHISLVLLALSLAFLIEVGGCLLIVGIIKALALAPEMMWNVSGFVVVGTLVQMLIQYRSSRTTQQDESLEVPES